MGIQVFGADKVAADFSAFANTFKPTMQKAIVDWVIGIVIPSAKLKAPVLTGNLRQSLAMVSITQAGDTTTFIVGWGTKAIYGKFQERGTKFVTAKRFVTRALTESANQLPGFWIKEIQISEVSKYIKAGVAGFGPLVL